jgi:hypothetical protein
VQDVTRWLLVLVAGCAPHVAVPASHPANRAAPPGRLAGAPASLRPGVVAYPDVPVLRREAPDAHHHHHKP